MQGYLFSRPVAKDDLANLLQRERSEAAAKPYGSRPNLEFTERRLIGRTPAV
jgi:hypothetical protein